MTADHRSTEGWGGGGAQRRCHQRRLPEEVTAGLRPEGEIGIRQGREGRTLEGPECLGGVLGCQRCTDAWPLAILEGFLGEGPALGRCTGVGWRPAQGTSQGSTEEGGAAPPVVLPVVMELPSTSKCGRWG